MRTLAVAALFLLTPALAVSQQPEPLPAPSDQTPTITVTSRIVALDALVRDKSGNLIVDLAQPDFNLKVDGHTQPVRYFNRDQDLPLTVGLLFDTSASQHQYFDDEALAGSIFLRDTLTRSNDRAFLVAFDTSAFLLQPFTHSLPSLNNGMRLLGYRTNQLSSGANATHLYDAIVHVCGQVLEQDPTGANTGRRAILILTDGEDVGSRANVDDAIRAAQEANTAVYSILYTRETADYPHVPGQRDGIGVMRRISAETGGREFLVQRGVSISAVFGAIAQELRSEYRLAFTPPESKPGKYHRIELKGNDPRLVVQARTGYWERTAK
ncbi:Ca-activated chloride channel family protein [Bryocella elongata]|uniref:Ca-activated chloride channel family protein n=1 Tax=Bryocella elongata TaxID=863522 RepID=A0A1H5XQW0_9BACT|nr:VWA domain-containing protein [Bryocella elongata]SEG14141.1 Ca-activated chloride channel family protein [Bryocella elongata]